MTTIQASVFSGFAGANPTLIARTVALINDPRLTSLEPLRQGLNNGEWIVRVATPTDPMNGSPALFINPQIDSQNNVIQRGQIVLRAEDLTSASDTNVLRLVDNLVHEGTGHGNEDNELARRVAELDLVNTTGGLSATTRGDNYLNSALDDESRARYEAYQFRHELAGITTEYSASNRASLATDTLYREFARLEGVATGLGLTGADKTVYVVEHSREQMAAYNNHSYPREAALHVIETLQLDGNQGQAYLGHVQQNYNNVGYQVTDVVTHDDGSSSASVIYENGARHDLVFDADGNLFQTTDTVANGDQTTTRFDAQGHTTQMIQTDGAHDNADYATLVTTYDTQGRTDSANVFRDDGTRDWVDYDQANASGFSRDEQHFDAQARADFRNIVGDDGSHVLYDFDEANGSAVRQWETRYDAQGRIDWANTPMDDGSHILVDYDEGNGSATARWETRYDIQGRTDWANMVLDDGSHILADYDEGNGSSANRWETRYDVLGRADWANMVMDDGSHILADYDEGNGSNANRWETRYDTLGRTDWTNTVMDDGSQILADYDEGNGSDIGRWETRYDTSGRTDWLNIAMDDGSHIVSDYDEDGSQGWIRVESHYDAMGWEEFATFYMDDGSVTSYDYAGAGGCH